MDSAVICAKLDQISALVAEVRQMLNSQPAVAASVAVAAAPAPVPAAAAPTSVAPVTVGGKRKCIHIITKKDKRGQMCGVTVSAKSKTGNYCTKHLNKEVTLDKEVKKPEKKVTKAAAAAAAPTGGIDSMLRAASKPAVEQKTQMVIRDDDGHFIHQITQYVMKQLNSNIVVGKKTSKGICQLTDRDIQICKSYGLQYEVPVNLKNTEMSAADINGEPVAKLEIATKEYVVNQAFEIDTLDNNAESDEEVEVDED